MMEHGALKISKERKTTIVAETKTHENDTGSPEVQVALITERIRHLTDHLKGHVKDHGSRRGLLMLVGKRTKLLKYLREAAPDRYNAVIERHGLRR
jgi:small subunit ribosomal protein S15